MKRLYQKIQIAERGFTQDFGCEIVKSRDNFTQTCVIRFPNTLYKSTNEAAGINNAAQGITALIKRNDNVKVWSGYNRPFENLPLRFSGFINKVEVNEDITVYCEDYGFVLKQINVPSKRFENATVKTVVEHALQGANITVEYDDPNVDIGEWVIDNNSNINTIQVLQKLEQFGIRSYFIGTTLRIGGITDFSENTRNFIFEHNIAEDNLIYRQDDQMNVVIKGISNIESGDKEKDEKVERFAYLDGESIRLSDTAIPGEQRTLNFYNKTKAQLDKILTDNFNKYIYEGFTGNFTTFLEPQVEPNDTINLWSLEFPERNGAYKCKSVVTKTSTDGGWQEVELDYKITNLGVV